MSMTSSKITRRSFFRLLTVGVVAAGATFAFVKRRPIEVLFDKLRYNLPPYHLVATGETGPLAPEEMENILRLAQVLIPWTDGKNIVAKLTRDFVDAECRYAPGALDAYGSASALLNRMAVRIGGGSGKYSDLRFEQQQDIVTRIIPAPIRSRRDWRHVSNILFRYEETRVTELVTNKILINFYNNDLSWGFL
jgi:hypothetical protein